MERLKGVCKSSFVGVVEIITPTTRYEVYEPRRISQYITIEFPIRMINVPCPLLGCALIGIKTQPAPRRSRPISFIGKIGERLRFAHTRK